MTPNLYEYIKALTLEGAVVELGSGSAEGQEHMNLKELFADHTGLDCAKGIGVDKVCDLSATAGLGTAKKAIVAADHVLCLELLEHLPEFWKVVDLFQSIKPGASLTVSVPTFKFHYHPFPVDCYRFSEDAVPALMTGFDIIDVRRLPDSIGQETLVMRGIRQEVK